MEFAKNKVKNYVEALARATKHIDIEEIHRHMKVEEECMNYRKTHDTMMP